MKEIEFLNMDLDLFYSVNGYPVHVASAGGYISLYYQNMEYDEYNLPKLVREIKPKYTFDQIIINPALRKIINFDDRIEEVTMIIEAVFSRNGIYDHNVVPFLGNRDRLYDFYIKKIYGTSFINMAKRGFLSFDRTDITKHHSDLFHWIAMPYDYFNNPHSPIDAIPSCEIKDFSSYINNNIPFQLIKLIDS